MVYVLLRRPTPRDGASPRVTIGDGQAERHENAGGRVSREQGETVQQVEEELAVTKRKAVTGGVRVTSSVSERPVQEKTGGGGLDG